MHANASHKVLPKEHVPPADSWWVGLDRTAFQTRATEEQLRMRATTEGIAQLNTAAMEWPLMGKKRRRDGIMEIEAA